MVCISALLNDTLLESMDSLLPLLVYQHTLYCTVLCHILFFCRLYIFTAIKKYLN